MILAAHLRDLDACSDALEWIDRRRSPARAWAECPRGDWLLWYAGKVGVDRKLLVRAACACARTALRYVPDGEDRPLRAIETAEAWTRGEASIDDVRAAAYAAVAAAAPGRLVAAAAAAAAAAYASADAAAAAADATYAASAANAGAAYASDAYASDAARDSARREHARLVRGIIPWSEVEALVPKEVTR